MAIYSRTSSSPQLRLIIYLNTLNEISSVIPVYTDFFRENVRERFRERLKNNEKEKRNPLCFKEIPL